MKIGAMRVKAQLFCDAEPAIGPGRADLLDAIAATGSISAASRATGISYRKAWLMVDAMNRCFCDKLVEADHRGARLSEAGRLALAAFRQLEARIAESTTAETQALTALLRAAPLPPA